MHRGKSAGSGKRGGEAAEAREAGHYRCRRWKMSGLRISSAKLQGKTRDGGKDSSGALPLQAPLPSVLQGSVWGSAARWARAPSPEGGRRGEQLSLPVVMSSLVLPCPGAHWPRMPSQWGGGLRPSPSVVLNEPLFPGL